jgi:LuxR family transcriptional regulator, maltose regulon positive regulatory protein
MPPPQAAGPAAVKETPTLLATKLHAPSRPGVIPRPELVSRLAELPSRRLILLGAPAGAGKTTLLSEWVASDTTREFAWLSLDRGDDAPIAFWTYVIESIRGAVPGLDLRSLAVLQAPGTGVVRDVLPHLLNDVAAADANVTLILDDYHVIGRSEIHGALAYLVDHGPENLQVAVSTRADPPLPLGRLRAAGELLELRMRDLRFGLGEVGELLNEELELGLERADLGRLHTRTEGWPAGVYLAALSLRGRSDRHAFVEDFAGDDRHVIDYLGAEVLAAQPDDVLRFLLWTSVLDRLSAPLCDAVMDDDRSAERL